MASNWAEAFEKLQSQDTPVQRRSAAARASTRVEVLREVVVQDRVADRAALQAPTSTLAEAVEKLRRLQARCEQSRTMAAHARGPKGQKAANAKLGGIRRGASPQARGPQRACCIREPRRTCRDRAGSCGTFRKLNASPAPQRSRCPSEHLRARARRKGSSEAGRGRVRDLKSGAACRLRGARGPMAAAA
jgi:hypothetical protein